MSVDSARIDKRIEEFGTDAYLLDVVADRLEDLATGERGSGVIAFEMVADELDKLAEAKRKNATLLRSQNEKLLEHARKNGYEGKY